MIALLRTTSLRALAAAALAAGAPHDASALALQLVSHVGDDYSYTLTYGPEDNMWWAENGHVHATLQLSGLFGVTAVSGPTSNDFPAGAIHDGQLGWVGSVLAGGSVVRFTMPSEDVGTGNFPTEKHVFGFTLTAPDTTEIDKIVFDSDGFYGGHTLEDRDVHALVSGPGLPARDPPADVPEAPSAALALVALLGLWRQRALRSRCSTSHSSTPLAVPNHN